MSWINSNATYKQNSKNDLSFYHGFSKTPVEPNTSNGSAVTTLANASTKSGHTVSATEVWASEIPWFGLVPSKAVAVTRLSGLTKKNDLVRVNGDKDYIYIGEGDEVFTEATWSTYWSPITLTNGMELKNQYGDKVLRYYEKQPMQALEPNNNAGIDSKGFATRLFVDESTNTGVTAVGQGSVISQFAAGTDNIKNGIASSELNPVLYLGTTQKIAGTHYYDYNVSGTILWNANVKSSNPKITCFRYIGKTVTQQVSEISSTVKTHSSEISEIKDKLGLGETGTPGTPTLGGRVTDNETALRVLLGLESNAKVAATESIATTAANAASTAISNATAALGTDGIFVDGQEAKLATVEGVIGYVEDYVAKNAAVTVKSGSYSKQITSLELAGSTGTDVNVSVTGADATTGSKYTFAATVNKATVNNGVADSADKLVTAGGAKSIAEKAATDAISSAIADGSTIDNRIDTVINTAIADGGVIDGRIDTLISDATSTSAIVDNDTSTKLVTAKQVSDYVASEVAAIDTGVASVTLGSTIPAGVSLGTDTKNPVLTIETCAAAAVQEGSHQNKLITAKDALSVVQTYKTMASTAAVNTIDGRSLGSSASSTQGSYISVTTSGTVGTGLTVNVNDSALASTVSAAASAIQGITINGGDDNELVKVGDGNIVDITLPSNTIAGGIGHGLRFSTYENADNIAAGYSGHYLHVAAASYDANTKTWNANTTDYFTTASTVESFVNATVGADLAALESKVNAYHEAGVSYKVHDSRTLPDLSVAENVKNYKNVILLVPTSTGGDSTLDETEAITGGYVEWLCVNKGTTDAPQWAWEQIGTTAADLHGYVSGLITNTSPVYGEISSAGYLTLGINSATSDQLGVSKLFSGDYDKMASVADKSNTAVSLNTASEMFTGLDSLKANKGDTIHSINGLKGVGGGAAAVDVTIKTGDNSKLIGLSIDTNESSKTITVSEGLVNTPHIHTIDLSAGVTSVEGNVAIINGVKTLIEPEKYVSGFYAHTASNLTSWVSDMPNFTNANGSASTFSGCTSLTTFIGDLSSLENGGSMFNNCTQLTTFIGDLSSLTNGESMFSGCSSLTSFTSELSSLTDAYGMFSGCKLDAESLEYIVDSLPTVTDHPMITIGYGSLATAADAQAAQTAIQAKGWSCEMEYNG